MSPAAIFRPLGVSCQPLLVRDDFLIHTWKFSDVARDPTAPHQNDSFCSDRHQRVNDQRMDSQSIQVQTLGRTLSIPADLNEAVRTLWSEGALYLKGAIKNKSPSDMIREDIIINDVVRSILFQTQKSIYITEYTPWTFTIPHNNKIKADRRWPPEVSSVWCIAFLGDKISYVMEVGKCDQEMQTEETVTLVMQPGDIFMCRAWLPRNIPRTVKQGEEQGEARVIFVHYLCRDEPLPKMAKQTQLADQIVSLGQRERFKALEWSEYVVWKA